MGSENKLPPQYYINCNGEVITNAQIRVDRLPGRYIIIDPQLIDSPPKAVTIIGKNATWEMKPR